MLCYISICCLHGSLDEGGGAARYRLMLMLVVTMKMDCIQNATLILAPLVWCIRAGAKSALETGRKSKQKPRYSGRGYSRSKVKQRHVAEWLNLLLNVSRPYPTWQPNVSRNKPTNHTRIESVNRNQTRPNTREPQKTNPDALSSSRILERNLHPNP